MKTHQFSTETINIKLVSYIYLRNIIIIVIIKSTWLLNSKTRDLVLAAKDSSFSQAQLMS